VRRKVTVGVREVRGRSSLAVGSYVSTQSNSCEDHYPEAGVDAPCTTGSIDWSRIVISFPKPNLDIAICAFHSIPTKEPVRHKSINYDLQ
jgi:hypothetical protein